MKHSIFILLILALSTSQLAASQSKDTLACDIKCGDDVRSLLAVSPFLPSADGVISSVETGEIVGRLVPTDCLSWVRDFAYEVDKQTMERAQMICGATLEKFLETQAMDGQVCSSTPKMFLRDTFDLCLEGTCSSCGIGSSIGDAP
jgi:hypothetical protein